MIPLEIETILEEQAPLLRKFAAHKTGTCYASDLADMAQDAQDVYQHGIESVLRMEHKQGDKKAFILNLANWRMASKAKKVRSTVDTLSLDAEDELTTDQHIEFIADDSIDPETRLIMLESAEELKTILADLKPEYLAIVRLMRCEYGIPEIAERMGVTYDAARKRIYKIRETLSMAGISTALMAG